MPESTIVVAYDIHGIRTLRVIMGVFATLLLLAGCSTNGGASNETTSVAEHTAQRTSALDGEGDITGFITENKHSSTAHYILIEADPNRDCRKIRDVRHNPKCRKIYLTIVPKTGVLREGDHNRRVAASPAELHRGQRVRAWATDALATLYPPQGQAHTVIILEQR